jgi:uncharacterized protein (UPF0147 family)
MRAEDKQKHTFFLRAGDVEYLQQILQPQGIPVSRAIRKAVSDFVDNLRARETQAPTLDIGKLPE